MISIHTGRDMLLVRRRPFVGAASCRGYSGYHTGSYGGGVGGYSLPIIVAGLD